MGALSFWKAEREDLLAGNTPFGGDISNFGGGTLGGLNNHRCFGVHSQFPVLGHPFFALFGGPPMCVGAIKRVPQLFPGEYKQAQKKGVLGVAPL